MALALEWRHLPNDSRYFYPIAVVFTFAALSGLASTHKPYQEWLAARLPWTRDETEYLIIINAGIHLLSEVVCERRSLSQMRAVATAFRFVITRHVLTSWSSCGPESTE